jgi:Domain of unknown function (DUF6531)
VGHARPASPEGEHRAVSTVKLLDIANTNHFIIYDAQNLTDWTNNIKPNLSGYTNPTPDDIENKYITKGYRVILPQRGDIPRNGWTGVGYLAIGPGEQDLTYDISPNLKGGYPDRAISAAFVSPLVAATTPVNPSPTRRTSGEPIDLATGAYLYDHDDLTVGTASFPFGLTFHRSYTSSNHSTSGPLGLGWSHGFASSATLNSDGLKGLGQDSPIDGARPSSKSMSPRTSSATPPNRSPSS